MTARHARAAGLRCQRGFTYLALLIVIAVMGAGMASFGELASRAAQREKEAELLFRGDQLRQAIASYYRHDRTYPKALADLLEDRRHPMPQRHLRKLYADPMTGTPDWALVTDPQGGIMGVHSQSTAAPLKTGNFDARDRDFADKPSYAEWKFVYQAPQAPSPPGPPADK